MSRKKSPLPRATVLSSGTVRFALRFARRRFIPRPPCATVVAVVLHVVVPDAVADDDPAGVAQQCAVAAVELDDRLLVSRHHCRFSASFAAQPTALSAVRQNSSPGSAARKPRTCQKSWSPKGWASRA